MSGPGSDASQAMERLSVRERATLAVLGLLALAALGALTWQRQRPELIITGAPALSMAVGGPPPAESAEWDRRLTASRQVDVNAAGVAELERLPGVGPALAKRIVEERERRGPFSSADDLARVPGIGPKTVESVKAYISAGE
jgi:competence ComEA-like helix-hairpin-helix protein